MNTSDQALSMKLLWILAMAVALAAGGCPEGTLTGESTDTPTSDASDVSKADSGPDTAPDIVDAAADASSETADDTMVDGAPDFGQDTVEETSVEEVASDLGSEGLVDGLSDIAPEIAPDTASEIAPDPGVETPTGAGDFDDDFAGDGPLLGYTTNNPNALPDIARVGGRYRANLTDNNGNITLHFNQDQGRLDAKLLTFPFEVIARNIGIGTQGDSQVAPPPTSNPFLFAGIQVHVTDLDVRESSHVVVGHRGNTPFTVEGKHTVNGNSSVNDDGANIVPQGRADIRIVGNADRTLTVYWQLPNLDPSNQADNWETYGANGSLPGPHPTYGEQVYVGLITYAYNSTGVPFVGTCDGVEGGSL